MKFIGADVHQYMLTAAEIDENLEIKLLKNFNMHDFINYLRHEDISIAAVDAPCGLNLGLMNNDDYRKKLNSSLKGHYNKKVSEYELSRRGINIFSTPSDVMKTAGWKEWMKTGFALYEELQKLGYSSINSSNVHIKRSNGMAEVFPHACFTTLLGFIPSKKDTDKGLQQRINLLTEIGFKNINGLLKDSTKHNKTDKLDALIAAYTAYLTYKGEVTFAGDVNEGQIVLPTEHLLDSYKKLKADDVNAEKIKPNAEFDNDTNIFKNDKNIFEYEYLNVDSVLWLKYSTPLNNSPSIKEIIKNINNKRIEAVIENAEGQSISAVFEPLRNRTDGLKAVNEYKQKLRNFWGSSGNREKYKIILKK